MTATRFCNTCMVLINYLLSSSTGGFRRRRSPIPNVHEVCQCTRTHRVPIRNGCQHQTCHLISSSCSFLPPAMPKVSTAKKKLLTIRGAPLETAVRVKTTSRAWNKNGRVTSGVIKTMHNLLSPEPMASPTPPSILPDLYPVDVASEGEADEPVLPPTQKKPSRAVSVRLHFLEASELRSTSLDQAVRNAPLERPVSSRDPPLGSHWRTST